MTSKLDFKIFDELHELLNSIEDPTIKEKQGSWSIKEVVGHLIDSACNNHNRFLRYDETKVIEFPEYNPDLCVNRNNYEAIDYNILKNVWYNYNLILLNSIKEIPQSAMQSLIKVGSNDPVTYSFLIKDYFDHLGIHLRQIERILSKGKN